MSGQEAGAAKPIALPPELIEMLARIVARVSLEAAQQEAATPAPSEAKS